MVTEATQSKAAGEFVARSGRFVAILVLLALALPTGFVAVVEGAGVLPLPYNLHLVDLQLPGIFRVHMLASGAALALIPAVIALRRHRRWHRPLGRLAAVFVVAGALTSFPVAYESSSVLPARLGFAAQGSVWLGLLVTAIAAIRRKDRQRHATLMLAMAAVASGAIWVRLATALVAAFRLPFNPIYGCVTWLGWMIPLALVLSFAPLRAPTRPTARILATEQ